MSNDVLSFQLLARERERVCVCASDARLNNKFLSFTAQLTITSHIPWSKGVLKVCCLQTGTEVDYHQRLSHRHWNL